MVLAGIGITVGVLYVVFQELFAGDTPQVAYRRFWNFLVFQLKFNMYTVFKAGAETGR